MIFLMWERGYWWFTSRLRLWYLYNWWLEIPQSCTKLLISLSNWVSSAPLLIKWVMEHYWLSLKVIWIALCKNVVSPGLSLCWLYLNELWLEEPSKVDMVGEVQASTHQRPYPVSHAVSHVPASAMTTPLPLPQQLIEHVTGNIETYSMA